MQSVKGESQKLGAFLEWMQEQGYFIYSYDEASEICEECGRGHFARVNLTIEALLAEYFGIDLKKLEQERTQILEDVRAANAAKV
jgi:hypothetical protein